MYHVHAKDTKLCEAAIRRKGILDVTPLEQVDERSWSFRTIGLGHDADLWGRIIGALADGGYDYVVSIEHEDELLDTTAAVTHSVEVLKPILARLKTPLLGPRLRASLRGCRAGNRTSRRRERMRRRIVMAAMGIAALLAVTATASGGNAKSSGVIQLTCMRCEASPSDVFSQSWYDVVQQFNTKYKNQYHVNVQHFGGQNENDLQYWGASGSRGFTA